MATPLLQRVNRPLTSVWRVGAKVFFVKFAGSKGIFKSCYEEIFNHITDISRGFPRNGG